LSLAEKTVKQAGIVRYVTTVYTLRHSFAAYIFTKRVNIRKMQELIGHKGVETAIIYPHILKLCRVPSKVRLTTAV